MEAFKGKFERNKQENFEEFLKVSYWNKVTPIYMLLFIGTWLWNALSQGSNHFFPCDGDQWEWRWLVPEDIHYHEDYGAEVQGKDDTTIT